jgi:phosphate transporter
MFSHISCVAYKKAGAANRFIMEAGSKNRGKLLCAASLLVTSGAAYASPRYFVPSLFSKRESFDCALLLTVATFFWVFNLARPELTALLILPAIVLTGVLLSAEENIFTALDASMYISKILYSDVVLLLVGSCLLSQFFKENGGNEVIISLLRTKSSPSRMLLRTMLLSLGLSSLMSNVTAPIIIISAFGALREEASAALVLGVAMASNVGGMLFPISSPQSILGLEFSGLSWLQWISISLPISLAALALIYLLIVSVTPPARTILEEEASSGEHTDIHDVVAKSPYPHSSAATLKLATVTAVSVLCWASSPSFSKSLRYPWIINTVPIALVLLASNSLLGALNWKTGEILAVAIGGLALGKSVYVSGLLKELSDKFIAWKGASSLFSLLVLSSGVMLVLSSLVCHTVSAIVLLPIFRSIGDEIGKSQLLVMVGTLTCSCGMAFPMSGFPNIVSSSLRNKEGRKVVGSGTFSLVGIASSLLCWALILTLGLSIILITGNMDL